MTTARRHVLVAAGLFAAALALRLWSIDSSYDIFIDEATYADIAASIAHGHGVLLYGKPFILHPPLGFLLLAVGAGLSGAQRPEQLVFALRPEVAVFGALVVVLLSVVVRRTGLRRAGILTGVLVALDPFQISYDSQVMLEALAQTWAVTTVLAATGVAGALAAGRRGRGWTAATAVAATATFATKETFGLVVAATLLLSALACTGVVRRRLLVALVGSVGGYALVNLAEVSWVGAGTWWESRTSGLGRLIGTHQTTGFNATGTQVSLWSRVMGNAGELGGSYLVLAAGGACGVVLWVLLKRQAQAPAALGAVPRDALAVLASWAVASCGYVGYAMVFGSLEEQMFYIALAPCTAALVLAAALLVRSGRLRRTAALCLVALVAAQSAVWVHVHTAPDDEYVQMLEWLPGHVQENSRIAVTEEIAQFLIQDQQLGEWHTVAQLRSHHVDYALVLTSSVRQGYGLATPAFLRRLQRDGELVHRTSGRQHGDLELFDVRAITGGSR